MNLDAALLTIPLTGVQTVEAISTFIVPLVEMLWRMVKEFLSASVWHRPRWRN